MVSKLATLISARKKNLKSSLYYRQKHQFIDEMATSPETVTRIQVAASDVVPTSTLQSMLEKEQDLDVLRTLLLNNRTPLTAIKNFIGSILAEHFNNDSEVVDHLSTRFRNN